MKLDETSLIVTVKTTLSLKALEDSLNERGYTLRYLPLRGGKNISLQKLLADPPANVYAFKYGELADLCVSVSLQTKYGPIQTRLAPRSATGPDLKKIFIGGHTTLGLFSEATLKVFHLPEKKISLHLSWAAPRTLADFVQLMRQSGIIPASLRPLTQFALQITLEGRKEFLKIERRELKKMVVARGGVLKEVPFE